MILVVPNKIGGSPVRRLEHFCGNARHSLRSTTQKAAGRVRLVLLPSLIAQIPAFMRQVAGVSRRSISLAVDFLSPAEHHAGSEVLTPSGFIRSNARAKFWVAALDFWCIGLNFRAGREPASEQRHRLEIAVTIAPT